MLIRGAKADRRIKLRTCLRHQRTRCDEIFKRLPDRLVVDVQLFFQCIQLCIVVYLPPFSMQHGILWLRNLPGIRL